MKTWMPPPHAPPPRSGTLKPGVAGKRTPNGRVWAHRPEGLYRGPEGRVWSRSMIEAAGGTPPLCGGDAEPDPCVIPPWPLLYVDREEEELDEEGHEDFGFDEEDDSDSSDDDVKISNDYDDEDRYEDENVEDYNTEADNAVNGESDDAVPAEDTDSDEPEPPPQLPNLEEFIPREHFPDILLVHDPYDYTIDSVQSKAWTPCPRVPTGPPKKYKRVYPKFNDRAKAPRAAPASDDSGTSSSADIPRSARTRTAHLDFARSRPLGVGNHSWVFRAPLRLPRPLRARTPSGEVAVAAKLAFRDSESRAMLHNEGRVYSTLPEHLMQDWSGYNYLRSARYDWNGITRPCAVVPKFYGYYVPVGVDAVRSRRPAPSPILLIENCGSSIEPGDLSQEQKNECFCLPIKLHMNHLIHNSLFARNLVMQPGPLSADPPQRSLATPSFRLIDFGRTDDHRTFAAGCKGFTADELRAEWKKTVGEEVERAKDAVYGEYNRYMVEWRPVSPKYRYFRPYESDRKKAATEGADPGVHRYMVRLDRRRRGKRK